MKAYVQGIKTDIIESDDALLFVQKNLEENKSFQIVTINPEMVMKSAKDDYLKNLLNEAELTIPDGVGIKIALKLKGIEAKHLRGIDFSRKLIEMADKNNLKAGFLGTKKEILNLAVQNIKKDYKNLNIVYVQDGFYDDEEKIINEIVEAKPNILFTALGFPKQEILNSKLKNKMEKFCAIGVGGSFDVWANVVDEAPDIWRKMGLEWLYRTIKQPERFKRIFPTLPIFVFKSIMDIKGKKQNGS